jgi:hypothetical protein
MQPTSDPSSLGKKHNQDLSAEQTNLYGPDFDPQKIMSAETERTRLLTGSQTREALNLDASDTELTRVKDLSRVKEPRYSDPSLPPSLIPPEMTEPTVIELHEQDLEPASPTDDLTFLHPRFVNEITRESLKEVIATSDEKNNPAISPENLARRREYIQEVISTPEISYEELNDSALSAYDLMESSELTLEEFLQKKTLMGSDMEILLWLIRSNFENQALWQFISQMAKDPYDVALIKKNIGIMTAKLLDSILVIGAIRREFLDEETDQMREIIIFQGQELDKGSIGMVAHVYFVYDDSLELREALMKRPMREDVQKQAFMIETYVARRIRNLLRKHPNDPRTKNILLPEFISSEFLIMPRISNEHDESVTLNKSHFSSKFVENGQFSVKRFCESLAGAARGLDFLSENHIIVSDNKPGNIVDSAAGGVVIDLGGFVDLDLFNDGYLRVLRQKDGSYFPVFQDKNNSRICFNVPLTDGYGNFHLLGQEILGELPIDISHKLSLAKSLEKLFCVLKLSSNENFSETAKKPSLERLKVPAIELSEHQLTTPELKGAYKLYRKLYHCHQHPYQYLDNDPQKGLDPEYISMSQVAEILMNIANN